MDDNPMQQMMAAISPMIPVKKPNNPVSIFVSGLFDKHFADASEVKLLRTIAINITNDDPNKVVEFLVEVYNSIGEFISSLNVAQVIEEQIDPSDDDDPDDDSEDDTDADTDV